MKNADKIKIPVMGLFVLNLLLPDYDYEYVIGYYEQGYKDLCESRNRLYAWRWFWSQVIKSSPVLMREKTLWSIDMLKNYLKIAFRNIVKNRLYNSLNIVGLALGL
ncbi:MAG: hypothetical protein GY863_22425, partial [bacterium]|nr:hypothetical protein [bacterium]